MKPTPLSLTMEEITAAHELVADGKLDPQWFEQCAKAAAENTFGIGFRSDRDGNPIEQGIGSDQNVTLNDISAYRKYCKDEPDFERHLARKQKLYDEQQEQRKKAKAAAR